MQHDWQQLDNRDAERCQRCGWHRLGINRLDWGKDLDVCPGPSKEDVERAKQTIRDALENSTIVQESRV